MKTQFFAVARSGKTIDGREITPEQIDQMAASYSPATYGARVNLEHYLSMMPDSTFRAQGDVLALKAESGPDGTRVLLAQIDATESLVKLTADRQKTYWSIEMAPNFAGTGKAYLVGLAATDTPASLGTDVIKFALASDKAPAEKKTHLFSEHVDAPPLTAESAPATDDAKTLFARVTELLSGLTGKTVPDDKRFSQVEAAVTAIAKEVGALKASIDAAKATAPAADPAVTALAKDFADLKTALETTSPTLFRKPSSGGAPSATATDC